MREICSKREGGASVRCHADGHGLREGRTRAYETDGYRRPASCEDLDVPPDNVIGEILDAALAGGGDLG